MIPRYVRLVVAIAPFVPLIGCAERLYLPGGFDMTPVATMPLTPEETEQRIAVAFNHSGGYNDDEANTSTELSYTIGTGSPWSHAALKGFFYTGSYHIDGEYRGLSGNELFMGVGVMGDGHLAIPIGPVSIGIGGAIGMMGEFGPYTDAYHDPDETRVWPLFLGYYLFTAQIDKRSELDLQLGVGVPGYVYLTAAYFRDRWGANIGVGPSGDIDNDAEEESGIVGRITLGLSYGL